MRKTLIALAALATITVAAPIAVSTSADAQGYYVGGGHRGYHGHHRHGGWSCSYGYAPRVIVVPSRGYGYGPRHHRGHAWGHQRHHHHGW